VPPLYTDAVDWGKPLTPRQWIRLTGGEPIPWWVLGIGLDEQDRINGFVMIALSTLGLVHDG
jgi:hypothetical protein